MLSTYTRLVLILLSFFAASGTGAAVFNVNTTLDLPDTNIGNGVCFNQNEQRCTLRAAVQESNAVVGPDVIVLPAGVYELDTTTVGSAGDNSSAKGDLDITSEITINGAGAALTTIQAGGDGTPTDRVLHVLSEGQLTFSDMTVSSGRAISAPAHVGGGILNEGSVDLSHCVVSNNRASAGGGIWSSGDVTIDQCLLQNNLATGEQANAEGGGLRLQIGSALIANSTFSGNSASIGGAGIHASSAASLTVENSTLSGNSGAAGIRIESSDTDLAHVTILQSGSSGVSALGGATDTLVFTNTLVAENGSMDCSLATLSVVRNDGNIDSDGTCIFAFTAPDPMLGGLALNGGETPNHEPLAGSTAIDNAIGPPDCLSFDQRGQARPVGVGCDIGAVEFVSEPAATLSSLVGLIFALVARAFGAQRFLQPGRRDVPCAAIPPFH